jgi:hypothetical chaperone protein
MSTVYAIDFGTTNSLLAAGNDGKACSAIPLDSLAPDPTVLRSILYTPAKNQWYFGASAIDQYTEHVAEGRLFRSIKKYLPETSFTHTIVNGKRYTLEDLIATFLSAMRERGNQHFNKDVDAAVFGRPAAFSLDLEKDKLAEARLRKAAELAGFKHIEFCPEPLAAAYEFRHTLTSAKVVLIADFGGGTSDFTVLKMGPQPFKREDVLAVGGVSVAGDRFDGAIMKHLISPHFGSQVTYKMPSGSVTLGIPQNVINKMCSPPDISFLGRDDINTLLRHAQKWSLDEKEGLKINRLFALVEEQLGYKLFSSIEHTKIALSKADSAPFAFRHFDIDVQDLITADSFCSVSTNVVAQICASLDSTIHNAGLVFEDIDIVCCTGGTAQIQSLRLELAARFGEQKLQQHRHFHSVVSGLAERALELT